MARQNYWESDFISGEVSPRMAARTDLAKYSTGVKTLKNFILQLQGGASKRSGTIFVKPTKTESLAGWLIPFIPQSADGYIIECANTVFRFYTDHGQLQSSSVAVQVTTPYLTGDFPLLDYAQSADTLFLTHPSYPPQQLKRTSPTSFALSAFPYQDGPYMTQNTTFTSLLAHSGFTQYSYTDPVSGITSNQYNGTGTITASGTDSLGNAFAPFVSTDVGRWVRILQGQFWGAVQITGFTSSTIVTGKVFQSMALGDSGAHAITIGTTTYAANTIYPTYAWRLGSWSNTTGWPSTVRFYQGRLVFGDSNTEPSGWWASVSGVFNEFSPTNNDATVVDSNGIGYTVNSDQLNQIEWMLSGQALLLGTFGAEWAVLAPSTGTPLTPSAISFQQQSAFGSKKVRPFLIGVAAIYVQRSGRKLREYIYDWSINGWRSNELSMLSEHLFRQGGGIVQATYQQEPSNVWWGCRADGTLIGMTYVKEQNILGFHRHTIGGSFNGAPAVVESIACIPTPDGTQDQLWMIVKRTINGQTHRYVEYMDVPFDLEENGKNSMNFVDCGIQNPNFPLPEVSPQTVWTGLNHLIGQTVSVCGDGSVQPSQVVANDGSVTLQDACSTVTLGLPYMAQLQTLSLPIPGDFGTSQGITSRIDKVVFRILESMTFKQGPDFNTLSTVPFAQVETPIGQSPPVFTGDVPIEFSGDYDQTAQIAIQSDTPYPLTILGMGPQMVVQPR